MGVESTEIKTMRSMAWERAKGELRSMQQTFWDNDEAFECFKKASEDFIEHVEDHGLYE